MGSGTLSLRELDAMIEALAADIPRLYDEIGEPAVRSQVFARRASAIYGRITPELEQYAFRRFCSIYRAENGFSPLKPRRQWVRQGELALQ